MANAQAILQGKITPYAYDYSQPPLGWIQIAGWVRLTGGIASFGNAINSGRVLMLILAMDQFVTPVSDHQPHERQSRRGSAGDDTLHAFPFEPALSRPGFTV